MTKEKKIIIIVSSMLVIGGVIGYLLYKKGEEKKRIEEEKKRIEDSANNPVVDLSQSAPITNSGSSVNPTAASPNINTTPKPTNVPTSGVLVLLVDVLASGLNKANHRTLFAKVGGLTIYNLQGAVAWKTSKGEVLGAIRSAPNVSKVYFARNGVDYFAYTSGMLVKM